MRRLIKKAEEADKWLDQLKTRDQNKTPEKTPIKTPVKEEISQQP